MNLASRISRPWIELAQVNFGERCGFRVLAGSQSIVYKRVYVEGVAVFEHFRLCQVDLLLHTIDITVTVV